MVAILNWGWELNGALTFLYTKFSTMQKFPPIQLIWHILVQC